MKEKGKVSYCSLAEQIMQAESSEFRAEKALDSQLFQYVKETGEDRQVAQFFGFVTSVFYGTVARPRARKPGWAARQPPADGDYP